jgi:hypothetical protein
MNWYLGKIIFRIIYETAEKNLFDEQFRLILAESESDAFVRAQRIGLAEEESFKDARDRTVQWQFLGIGELRNIKELCDGVELISKTEEPEDEVNYISLLQLKNAEIQQRISGY